MNIVWQNSSFPSSDMVPDYGIGYIWNALSRQTGIPPGAPTNTTSIYVGISGTIDGVNARFTLTNVPVDTLQMYRNGVELSQGAGFDYTLATNVVTFQPGAIPQPGDVLVAIAIIGTRYNPVTGTIDGVNTVFTLTVSPVAFLALYRNGVLQNPFAGGDYTLVGATITFNTGSIPQPGDLLLAKTA